ncbi:MAG: cytochrome c553 [Myxococcota bacterium]|jgi:cytochrome c553
MLRSIKTLLVAGFILAAPAVFASQPTANSETVTSETGAEAITAARPAKLKKCAGCHSKELTGKKKAPNIAGASKAKLMASMGHGIAPDKVGDNIKPAGKIPKAMKGVAKKLTDAQKAALASFISACPKTGCPTE